ncbi:SRPBCC domain-containing protein [candidate division CSSED10-310 bacterium]|uniref:SRPBCC domain-containing protein n=1 Tax=candidate division CSSED10-310 bacterium TaxID=2855610 RepID=A0ABV6Z030_UNCC1
MSVEELPTSFDQIHLKIQCAHLSPEKVFSYWIEPELLTKWWPQEAEIEVKAGGKFHLSWSTMNWHLRGTIVTLDFYTKLAFTWKWDHEPDHPVRNVMVTFSPAGQGTIMNVIHESYQDTEEEQKVRQEHLDGWKFFGVRLLTLTEKNQE